MIIVQLLIWSLHFETSGHINWDALVFKGPSFCWEWTARNQNARLPPGCGSAWTGEKEGTRTAQRFERGGCQTSGRENPRRWHAHQKKICMRTGIYTPIWRATNDSWVFREENRFPWCKLGFTGAQLACYYKAVFKTSFENNMSHCFRRITAGVSGFVSVWRQSNKDLSHTVERL